MTKLKRALKQAKKIYSDEIIEGNLTYGGSVITDYCIFQSSSHHLDCTIHQVFQGEEWLTMGMSDYLYLACVDFLKRQGVPVFTESSELEKYLEELKARHQQHLDNTNADRETLKQEIASGAQQLQAGQYTEYDDNSLPNLLLTIKQRGQQRLKQE